jgi:hypothetical protein
VGVRTVVVMLVSSTRRKLPSNKSRTQCRTWAKVDFFFLCCSSGHQLCIIVWTSTDWEMDFQSKLHIFFSFSELVLIRICGLRLIEEFFILSFIKLEVEVTMVLWSDGFRAYSSYYKFVGWRKAAKITFIEVQKLQNFIPYGWNTVMLCLVAQNWPLYWIGNGIPNQRFQWNTIIVVWMRMVFICRIEAAMEF